MTGWRGDKPDLSANVAGTRQRLMTVNGSNGSRNGTSIIADSLNGVHH